jgi:membrane protein implicated in regulation of membrane protease activity
MPVVAFLVAWANVPFGVALGISLVFAVLSWSGALSLLGGAGDGDGDADHDGDGEHDGDADHDADDSDGDDDEVDDGKGVVALVLAPLGIGKVPLSVLWQSFAVVFAVTGYAANARYIATGAVPLRSLAWTLPLALIVAYGVVALLARLLKPLFSSETSEASSRSDLVGQVGVVISRRVTEEFGEVRFRDKTGHDVRLVCALDEGTRPASEGEKVVVVGVDPDTKKILVAPLDPFDEPRPDASHEGPDQAVPAHKSA